MEHKQIHRSLQENRTFRGKKPFGNLVNYNNNILNQQGKEDFLINGKTLGSYFKKIKIKSYFKIKHSDEANTLHFLNETIIVL